MKRVRAILPIMLILYAAGCATPRCDQARMKVVEARGAKFQEAFDAAHDVLSRHFEILYEDPASGTISTRCSQAKSPEEGIVSIRAIALVTEEVKGPVVYLKVVKERHTERWDIWGQNIVEGEEFLGNDPSVEQRLIYELKGALGAEEKAATVRLPGTAVPAAPVPAPAPAPGSPPAPAPPGGGKVIAPPPPSAPAPGK